MVVGEVGVKMEVRVRVGMEWVWREQVWAIDIVRGWRKQREQREWV